MSRLRGVHCRFCSPEHPSPNSISAQSREVCSLPAGSYRITAEAQGFQKATSELTAGVDHTVTSDFHLSVGNVSETVKVTEQPTEVAVEKDSHQVSFVSSTQTLENLPTSSRSFLNVVTLGPGLQKSSDAAGGPYTNFGSGSHQVVVGGQIIGIREWKICTARIRKPSARIISRRAYSAGEGPGLRRRRHG